jgi:hypothetical protein
MAYSALMEMADDAWRQFKLGEKMWRSRARCVGREQSRSPAKALARSTELQPTHQAQWSRILDDQPCSCITGMLPIGLASIFCEQLMLGIVTNIFK